MDVPHFLIRSSVAGHLSCFYLLAVVNTAAVHISVQILVETLPFSSFAYRPRSRIAGSRTNPIFNLLGDCQAVFHSNIPIGDA